MKLPFTTQQFFDVFKDYNLTVFPMQFVLLLLAAIALVTVYRKRKSSGKIVFTILGLLWLWTGIAYHFVFFTAINKAALGFGTLFVVQGLMFLFYGLRKSPAFDFSKNLQGVSAVVLILYALVIYPTIGFFTGHVYPYSPTFGLPCPTTIFTFGVLLLAKPKLPVYLIVVPLLWALIGMSAALTLGVYEDLGLLVAAVTFIAVRVSQRRFHSTDANPPMEMSTR